MNLSSLVDQPPPRDVPPGTPFLLGPDFDYDVDLNRFFASSSMLLMSVNTQVGYARDIGQFLTFLSSARGQHDWKKALETDFIAYYFWRCRDESGPRVSASTWNREVAAINKFYRWQLAVGIVDGNPVPQRVVGSTSAVDRRTQRDVPAAVMHGGRRTRMRWLPSDSYRRWRDVGIRGFDPNGMPSTDFRGRWASRNATFCDLMVRTGLRLSEQAALLVSDVPRDPTKSGYQRFWLPAAVSKNGAARWVYVPSSVARDLDGYLRFDRSEAVAEARDARRYERTPGAMVFAGGKVTVYQSSGATTRPAKLDAMDRAERRRILIETPEGLEPAALWLSERGLPVAVPTWKSMFRAANARCERQGVSLHCSAHTLRHSFAVLTLEQLQRGHISKLSEFNPQQRQHYVQIFGDPLDWVRRCLGHRSVETTQIYLHALAELEMETRMALISDAWDDPRLSAVGTVQSEMVPAS
ncbi:tyrosine-type recombinase/integrase [Rhodococcus kroppenstedtii]|uniref:Tyrosine-type recombinase/integrase n=2 Tax=Mycobacteriales TaxID=85007 RepID=A0ABS7NXX8_9NOCA|nr:tyrosine-type recombinase/integrase [Rhodococcus kroppenstedtii]MBY6322910.1 tyrosine-type recombinase/integrase [Rhodococcus kroppenstedtii]MBY6401601.1 tyrosine-type recombinase/integrase [Rhodococcus kroppenstedtii]